MSNFEEDCQVFITRAVKGNEHALGFLLLLFNILHTWDDLVDNDKPVSSKTISGVFWDCLITLPSNGFFQHNKATILPILSTIILQWEAATNLEKTKHKSEHSLHIAFILRSTYADLITHCALLIGGYEWARQVSIELREFNYEESFCEYQEEIRSHHGTM